MNGSLSIGRQLPDRDANGKLRYDNLHLRFEDCAGYRVDNATKTAKVLPKCTGAGDNIAGKVCAALSHNDHVDDIKVGCTGAIAQDAIVVKGWAEGDNPQGLHIRCAKRLWEEKVKTIIAARKFQHSTGTTAEEEAKTPSAVATADLDDL